MPVDPAQLRMLALVDAHGSLAGAAAELGLTPGALTGQVSKAERDWGVPLVLRSPRGARLTEAGATLARHGLAVDEVGLAAESELGELLGRTSPRVRIGSFLSVATRVLPQAMTALRHRRPDSELSIVEGTSTELRRRVTAGELDIAVVGTYVSQPELAPWLVGVPLLDDPMVACLPREHRLASGAAGRPVRFAQLRGERWVAIQAGDAAREQFDRVAADQELDPQVVFETESYDVAQAMVGTGLGVAVLARLAMRRTAGVVHRELERPRLTRRLWAVHHRDTRLTPLVDELVALLGEVCAELQESGGRDPSRSLEDMASLPDVRGKLGAALFLRVAGPDGPRQRERIHFREGPRWFEAGSPITRVHGDASMFVGGLRALLLQTLHPAAMQAVSEHSGFRGDMWGRLHRTSTFLAVTTFGVADDAQHAVDAVRHIHERVTGTLPDGTPYVASDPHLLAWVHAAEADSFLRAHQVYGREPLDQAGRDEYVAQIGEVGARLGVVAPPTTEAELTEVLGSYRPELRGTPAAREAVRYVLLRPPLPLAARAPYGVLAAAAIGQMPAWTRLPLRLPYLPVSERTVVRALGGLATGTIRWAMSEPDRTEPARADR